jgi:hypothetical protein
MDDNVNAHRFVSIESRTVTQNTVERVMNAHKDRKLDCASFAFGLLLLYFDSSCCYISIENEIGGYAIGNG